MQLGKPGCPINTWLLLEETFFYIIGVNKDSCCCLYDGQRSFAVANHLGWLLSQWRSMATHSIFFGSQTSNSSFPPRRWTSVKCGRAEGARRGQGWEVRRKRGGPEGGESCSKAICSCVITALRLGWLRLNPPLRRPTYSQAGRYTQPPRSFCIADCILLSQQQAVE